MWRSYFYGVNMKVKDLEYKRVDVLTIKEKLIQIVDAIKNASDAEAVLKARKDYLETLGELTTAGSLCYMRYTLNSFDEFYCKEKEYYDQNSPLLLEVSNAYAKAMLDSPFRGEVEKRLPETLYPGYELAVKINDPRIADDLRRESELVMEYSTLMSRMLFEYNGNSIPLTLLKGYLQDTDRNVRKQAAIALGKGLEANSEKLDEIYDNLVHVRHNMAKTLGFENYIALGYMLMSRIDYQQKDVENFRKNVLTDLVPVVGDLKKHVANKLGLDKIYFYDNEVTVKGGEPKPILDKKGIFEAAQKMYDGIHPMLGKFMRSMQEAEAFDVDSREGKWGGGYCTSFEKYKQPFILANFNGSASDIDTITHEFGHAYAMQRAFEVGDYECNIGSSETAECHSMSMEFLSWKYMDLFFGKDKDRYCYKHLLDSISFIPYGVIVDEFQHIVYSNPDMTPAERNEAYRQLELKYRPFLSYEGIPYLDKGTRWQYQMHIYETPFYYIDYCLAQTVALNFLILSQKDYNSALQKYLEFVDKGGSEKFSRLVKEAGFASPFERGALKTLSENVMRIVEDLEKRI